MHITKEKLQELLSYNNITATARILNTTTHTIYKKMKKYGIRRKKDSGVDMSVIGKKFNKLIVESYHGLDRHNKAKFLCTCDCGNKKIINISSLKRNLTKSCGCAGGFTFEMATLNAIYELIERDSFMCFWLTKTNPTRIHLEKGVSETFDLALNFLNLSHYELFVLDITTDLKIPSVLCVIKGKVNNAIMIAASSKETLLDAIESAVLEVMSCGVMSNQEKFFELDLDTPVYLNTKISRDERVNFWIHRGSTAGLDFLLNENKILKITKENQGEFSKKENDSDKIKLDKLLTKLKGEGEKIENIYVYEFKNKYIEKIGFKVVRVVIPYLYPIYLFEYTKLSLSKRLDDFNLSKSGTKVFELNQEIHPFP